MAGSVEPQNVWVTFQISTVCQNENSDISHGCLSYICFIPCRLAGGVGDKPSKDQVGPCYCCFIKILWGKVELKMLLPSV